MSGGQLGGSWGSQWGQSAITGQCPALPSTCCSAVEWPYMPISTYGESLFVEMILFQKAVTRVAPVCQLRGGVCVWLGTAGKCTWGWNTGCKNLLFSSRNSQLYGEALRLIDDRWFCSFYMKLLWIRNNTSGRLVSFLLTVIVWVIIYVCWQYNNLWVKGEEAACVTADVCFPQYSWVWTMWQTRMWRRYDACDMEDQALGSDSTE